MIMDTEGGKSVYMGQLQYLEIAYYSFKSLNILTRIIDFGLYICDNTVKTLITLRTSNKYKNAVRLISTTLHL